MAIYSKNGGEPTELPNRIYLSTGVTRTDNSTFTPAELADAGYILVADKPLVEYPSSVAWDGASEEWKITTLSIDQVKRETKQQVTDIRYEKETTHPLIDTSKSAQAMINGMWSTMQLQPTTSIDFKDKFGNWTTMDKTMVDELAQTISTYVQACFTNEKTIHTLIDECTNISEILAIDKQQGWNDLIVYPDPGEAGEPPIE